MSKVAKIAVSGLPFHLDRPYDYAIPERLETEVEPGRRVLVPFTNSNRPREGLVLALRDESAFEKLKPIGEVLDAEPVLDERLLALALWMRERFFCTVYEAAKAMLPAGLWYSASGKRRVTEKYVAFASLAVPAEEAAEAASRKRMRAPQQSELLKTLCAVGRASVPELLEFTGAPRQSLNALVSAGYVELRDEEVFRRPEVNVEREELPELNESQLAAFEGINALASGDKAAGALLFGVTGSGKTTIYMRLIAAQRAKGRGCILLVPEIALTPQMLRTFAARFGDDIAVLHSSLSAGERYDEWRRIKSGAAGVVIGTRSAVFAPVKDLGLVIIDEEQEDTYKSENAPRYHARDVATYRCAADRALLLLGSATPDVESRYHASTGRYAYFTLPGRFNSARPARGRGCRPQGRAAPGQRREHKLPAPLRAGGEPRARRAEHPLPQPPRREQACHLRRVRAHLPLSELLGQPHLPQLRPQAPVSPVRVHPAHRPLLPGVRRRLQVRRRGHAEGGGGAYGALSRD